jgi:hypothetical protein
VEALAVAPAEAAELAELVVTAAAETPARVESRVAVELRAPVA